MSAGLAYNKYDKGGLCYAACQEAFEWYHKLYLTFCKGGMPQPSGAKRAVTSGRAARAIHS